MRSTFLGLAHRAGRSVLPLAVLLSFLPFGPPVFATDVLVCSPEPTNMLISPGDSVVCQLEVVGDTDAFRFQGNAGDKIVILV